MASLFLIARIAGRTVAIDSDQVDSVVDIGDITPIPRAVPEVRGLAALRSRVVMVIDTRAALGLPPADIAPTRAVITLIDGHHYAVLVDALEDVAPFSMTPLSGGILVDGGWAKAGCGIVDRHGDPLLVINLRSLIPGIAIAA
ncbi:chemotaxis protein CheW [Sphingomonas sp. 28-63-12]|uniref:chemotaxis protein CheW n=1 Tax=Sphingomonas sp. 28-63-12 TaxID=1970434 RepID=UPI000BDCEF8C|nr:MAG: chemotaxis protein CheW [Sphingomonas sp. 28-63-12]